MWTWIKAWWAVAAWPLRVLMIAVPLALGGLGVYGLANVFGRAYDHVSWWWSDREDAKSAEKIEVDKAELEANERKRLAQQAEIELLRGQNEVLRQSVKDLGVEEEQLDAVLSDDDAALANAQSGELGPVPDRDAQLARLRALYPKRPRPPAR